MIYWVLIPSPLPQTKRSLWAVKQQRQVWPVCCNKSGARSRWSRVRKHTEAFLSYTCAVWATQKIFDHIALEFVFKAGNNKRGGYRGENVSCCGSHWTRTHRLHGFPGQGSANLHWGFFVNVKHSYKSHFIFFFFFLFHYGKMLLGLKSTFYKYHWNYIKSFNQALWMMGLVWLLELQNFHCGLNLPNIFGLQTTFLFLLSFPSVISSLYLSLNIAATL